MSSHYDASIYVWRGDINYRLHPHLYKVGKGEQGVLLCEPYKSEILPFWKFRTPILAEKSAKKILALFYAYLGKDDFIGADMARKFLQMGFTRARRYTNYKGGRKYDPSSGEQLARGTGDPLKAKSASLFYACWQQAEADEKYSVLKQQWKNTYG